MEKNELAQLLRQNHLQFIEQIRALSDRELLHASPGKWNALQHLDHLIKSISPVNMAMSVPKFILNWKFGVANRPSRTYDALVDRYYVKLQAGGKAPGPFVPPADVDPADKESLLHQLNKLSQKLANKTLKHNEWQLDRYILPHPLLGKLTLREMLYFTAYHVAHHGKNIEHGLVSLTQ